MRTLDVDPRSREDVRSIVDGLETRLADRGGGRLGALVVDVDPDRSGAEPLLAARPDVRFGSASAIKVLVLHALYHSYDGRLETLADPRPIADENRVGGCGILRLFGGSAPSIEDLAYAMIAVSDNAATNELIDLLGFDAVGLTASMLGLEGTRLGRKMMRTPELDSGIDLEPADDGAIVRSNGHRYVNTVTPRDCVRLFRDVHREGTYSTAAYDRLRRPLEAQNDGSMARRYVPDDAVEGHKTGTLPSVAVDAGLLTVGGRTVAFTYCCDGLENGGDGADAVAELGYAVYRYLARSDGG